jgi:hypothetical protein
MITMASVVTDPTSGTQLTTSEVTFNWRKEQFEKLGFNDDESAKLAESKVASYTGGKDKNSKKLTWETPLHHETVARALKNGCTHAQALEIFLS